jgi:hypothetical protein
MILIAACYSPVLPSNVPCSPSGECPDGQSCTAGTCVLATGAVLPDAAPRGDAVTVADRDLDGVVDGSDNCPDVANPDQTANEDGDRFGDACDPCPQITDNAPVDTDGDRLGDACDPNPGTRDVSWLFEGFHKGMPAWPGSTNWAPLGDKLRVIAPGNAPNDGGYLVLPLSSPGRITFDNFSVATTVLVEQMTGSNGDHSFGVSVFDDNVTRELDCYLDQGSGAGFVLFLTDDNGVKQKQTFSWMINTEYRITLVRHGTTYTCSVVGPGGGAVTLIATSQIVPRTGADMSIWAYGVTAQFGSVFVVGP